MNNEIESEFHELKIAPMLSRIERLQWQRSYRDKCGQFFIEGIRNFIHACDNFHTFEALLYSEKLLINPVARKLVRRLKRGGIPFARVSPEQFRRISKSERASGVSAIIRKRWRRLEELDLKRDQCWTAVDHVRSPGNFGSLVRTSAASGGGGFILMSDAVDPFDPVVIRASMGTIFRQSFIRTDPETLRRWGEEKAVQIIGASPQGSVDYDSLRYGRPVLLLLGNERRGLTGQQLSFCDQIVRIPMADGVDSLNLAAAGALLMYELFRSSSNRFSCRKG